ncbi:MAG TPA: SDR family NAD(P)-dependent oxidoreductase [Verrucomicrobiae bacterium]|jgi:3-oxoacyl-[acyl-carrier protein] reductase|nr:SDR family NAD(P)-dependent oxidoreductase [Verrucomicrobiae bacterium]
MRLQGKTAVITGGAQGIGRAIALGLAREGASVVIADLQGGKAEAAAGETRALGVQALAVETDVASERSVDNLAGQALGRFNQIDILVNDAGIFPQARVTEMSEDDWDRVLDVNLGGNFLCCRAFAPSMRAQKSGRIISIASGIAHTGGIAGAHYAASKAGIVGFIKALARELGPDGITANAICPNIINTELPRSHRTAAELHERLIRNPLGHAMEPEDLVGTILFLASDAARYITGQAVNVNCGTVMI